MATFGELDSTQPLTGESVTIADPTDQPYPVEAGKVVVTSTTAEPVLPTQVAHPWQSSWRTFVQAFIALVPLLNGIALAVQSAVTDSGLEFPAWAWAVVNGAVVVTAFGTMLVTRVMNAPGVNGWIEAHARLLAPSPVSKPKHAAE